MTQPAFGQWSSTARFVKNKPSWVPASHQDRIAAYDIYEHIYWSHIDSAYKVMNRGLDADDEPLYVPSSRIMVDTLNRYIGPKLTYAVDPLTGSETTQLAAVQAFQALFARERFDSRYNAAKRQGLIHGDFCWHLMGDPNKPEGTRIRLVPVSAKSYFPVYQDETIQGGDPDTLVMVILAEQVVVGEDLRVRTQRYLRQDDGTILSTLDLWEPDKWFLWRYDDDEAKPVQTLLPPVTLPPQITAFPVYHVPHRPTPGEVFGNSPMRGLEILQSAVNQSMTDEDLALALMGLGLYTTDQPGSPIDPVTGEARSWMIYPGAVIENGKGLRKVEGISTLAAYNDHIGRLEGYFGDASGATDAARGRLEVAEAESGIALQLRLAPTLALAEEQDAILLDVHRQMFHDLVQMWFPTYEGANFTDVTMLPVLGDKLPVNRAAEVGIVNELVLAGILSAGSARQYLVKKGFTDMFDPREGELVLAEKVAIAAAEGGDTALEDREAQEQAPEGGEEE
jgi:hypothetical protein